MKKKIISKLGVGILGIALTIGGIGISSFANNSSVELKNLKTLEVVEPIEIKEIIRNSNESFIIDIENMSLDEFIATMGLEKTDFSVSEYNQLVKAFDNIKKAEKSNKEEDIKSAWEKFNSLLPLEYGVGFFNLEDLDGIVEVTGDINAVKAIDFNEINLDELLKDFGIEKDKLNKTKYNNLVKAFNKLKEVEKSLDKEKINSAWEEFNNILLEELDIKFSLASNISEVSFEDFIYDLEVTNKEKASLKEKYDFAIKCDKENKFKEANNAWDEFFKELEKYIKPISFEDIIKGIELSVKDKNNAEKLYNEILKLEEQNLEKNNEVILKKWAEFDKILGFDKEDICTGNY